MPAEVTFCFTVEVDDEFLPEDPEEEDAIESAEEIIYSAPSFDGLSDDFMDSEVDAMDVLLR